MDIKKIFAIKKQYRKAPTSQKWQFYIAICKYLYLEPYNRDNMQAVETFLLS